jgi:hypothetical protein
MERSKEVPMRNPIAGCAGIALLASLAFAPVSLAQPQTTPAPPQPPPQQNQDSVAEAAAKAKAAKSTPTGKRVYTDEDLKGKQGGISVAGDKKGDSRAANSNAAGNPSKNEQYWRSRAQQLRNQMAEVDRQIAELAPTNQTNASGRSASGSSTPPPPSAYTVGAHARADVPMQRLQGRKAQIQAQMDQLEDEARRAGVPPGWLR